MSKEEKDKELLETKEEENVEGKEAKKGAKPNKFALVLMIIILLGIALFGGYFTYYQYKRMEEINSKKAQPQPQQ